MAICKQTWAMEVADVDLVASGASKIFSSCEMLIQGGQPRKFLLEFCNNVDPCALPGQICFWVKSLSGCLNFMVDVRLMDGDRAVISTGYMHVSSRRTCFTLCTSEELICKLNGKKTATFVCNLKIPAGGHLQSSFDQNVCKFENLAMCRDRLVHDLTKAASPDLPFSDLTLICQDRSFAGHKVLLSARSDVFAAMFSHEGMVEASTGSVKITDMEPDTLEQMLKFMYTDELEEEVLLESACKLLAAADKYNIRPLAAVCEHLISSTVDIDTAVPALAAAYLHGSDNLKDYLLNFAKNNMLKVSQTSDWEEFLEAKQSVFQEISKCLLKCYISDSNKVKAGT